jgi:hypothetical protein
MHLQGTGLPQIWTNWFVPKSNQCVRFNTKVVKPRLSVNHLISSFVLLAIGCGLSFVVFLFELIAAGRLSGHKGSHDNKSAVLIRTDTIGTASKRLSVLTSDQFVYAHQQSHT